MRHISKFNESKIEFGENKQSLVNDLLKDLKSRYSYLTFQKEDDGIISISTKIGNIK